MKIMFICTGNICRSAMAHAMLEQKVKSQNKKIEVYSCGIFAYNGDRPTEEAISVLNTIYNVDLTSHKATNIENAPIKVEFTGAELKSEYVTNNEFDLGKFLIENDVPEDATINMQIYTVE